MGYVLTVRDGAGRKDGLFPLPETRVDAVPDQNLGDGALVVLAVALALLPRPLQALVVVARVVDVAELVAVLGAVNGAEVPRAQEAPLEECCRGRKVARVLLVAEVARLDDHGVLRSRGLGGRLCCGLARRRRRDGARGVDDDGGRRGRSGRHLVQGYVDGFNRVSSLPGTGNLNGEVRRSKLEVAWCHGLCICTPSTDNRVQEKAQGFQAGIKGVNQYQSSVLVSSIDGDTNTVRIQTA